MSGGSSNPSQRFGAGDHPTASRQVGRRYVIGIDPGGAVAKGQPATACFALFDGTHLECHDVETHHYSGGHKVLDPSWLLSVCAEQVAPPLAIGIEKVQASPKMGASSSFSFGNGSGVLFSASRCILLKAGYGGAEALPRFFAPAVWKRAYGLGSDKNRSLHKACEAFPGYEHLFTKADGSVFVRRHNWSEAALIAAHLWHQIHGYGDELECEAVVQ